MRHSAETRVKKTQYIRPDLRLDVNNNGHHASITELCTPTPEYESGRLHILGSREAHLELWPLAVYDKVSLGVNSRRGSTSTFLFNPKATTDNPETTAVHLMWADVSYAPPAETGILRRISITRPILKWISGYACSGSMTAVLGPSNEAKSAFLKCITRSSCENMTGQVFVRFTGGCSQTQCKSEARFSFVPQTDHICEQMTVKEAIMFASQLHNPKLHPFDHKWNLQETLGGMGLGSLGNRRVGTLTEAQLKRTAIAIALSSYPNILVMDEPTRGLSTEGGEALIRMVKDMAKRAGRPSPAIVTTISHPSTDCLMMFDNVCLLSRDGENIYFGPPQDIISFYDGFGFDRKSSVAPAEYMMEIANGKYGYSCFKAMASKTRQQIEANRISGIKDLPLTKVMAKTQSSFLQQFWLITLRLFSIYTIKSVFTVIQLLLNLLFAVIIVHFSTESSLSNKGCWNSISGLIPNMTSDSIDNGPSSTDGSLPSLNYRQQVYEMTFVSALLFIHPIYFMFMSIVSSLWIFPREIKSVAKEIVDACYSPGSYFVAVTVWQITTALITTAPSLIYIYVMAGFPFDDWHRFFIYFTTCFMQTFIWMSRSLLFSIIFESSVAAFVTTISFSIVALIFSGILPLQRWSPALRPLAGISDIVYEFPLLLNSLYGYGRCDNGAHVSGISDVPGNIPSDGFASDSRNESSIEAPIFENNYLNRLWGEVNENLIPVRTISNITRTQSSFVLDYYEIQERDVVYNFAFLILVVLVTRIFIYFSLKMRASGNRV